jgi:hypothetical protein
MLIHTGERRSGRTERSIKKAVQLIDEGAQALTFCATHDCVEQLTERLAKELRARPVLRVEVDADRGCLRVYRNRETSEPQIVTFVTRREHLSSHRGQPQVADHSFIEQEQRLIAKHLEWLEKLLIR